MHRLKVTAVGDPLGVTLPEEVLARFKVKPGDELTFIETPDGYELTASNSRLARTLELGRAVARKYREALRALAKS